MSQSFPDLCAEFLNKTRYCLSFIPIVPNEKILTEMQTEGWKRVPYNPTPKDFAAAAAAVGHGVVFMPSHTIVDADGVDIFENAEAGEKFHVARQRAAAKVYGLNT